MVRGGVWGGVTEEWGEMGMEQTSLYSALRPLCIILPYSPAALGEPSPSPVKSNLRGAQTLAGLLKEAQEHVSVP